MPPAWVSSGAGSGVGDAVGVVAWLNSVMLLVKCSFGSVLPTSYTASASVYCPLGIPVVSQVARTPFATMVRTPEAT